MSEKGVNVTVPFRELFNRSSNEQKEFLRDQLEFYIDQFKHVVGRTNEISLINAIRNMADEEITKSLKRNTDIKCKKGCSACCHINVSMTFAEAVMILIYCRKNGIEIDTAVLEKQKGLRDKERARSEFSACVFLKDKICTIYPVRPLLCQKYMVVSDPKFCDATVESHEVLQYMMPLIETVMSALGNIDIETGDMAEMMLAALKEEDKQTIKMYE